MWKRGIAFQEGAKKGRMLVLDRKAAKLRKTAKHKSPQEGNCGHSVHECDDCNAQHGGKTDLQHHVTFRICKLHYISGFENDITLGKG